MTAPSDSEQPFEAELMQLRQDAARWRYVRDRWVVHTGGRNFYCPPMPGDNLSFTEVIDKLIAAEREQPQEGEQ